MVCLDFKLNQNHWSKSVFTGPRDVQFKQIILLPSILNCETIALSRSGFCSFVSEIRCNQCVDPLSCAGSKHVAQSGARRAGNAASPQCSGIGQNPNSYLFQR